MGLVMFGMCLIPIVKKIRIKGEFMIVLQSKKVLPGLSLFYHYQGEARATEVLWREKFSMICSIQILIDWILHRFFKPNEV